MNKFLRVIIAFGPWLGVFLPIATFVWIHAQPVAWTNGEIVYHGLFWSLNSHQDTAYHTGLWFSDWAKIFDYYFVDGIFRVRHLSYLIEMLTFKFGQLFGAVYLRNWGLILIHIINSLLVGKLIHQWRQNRTLATLAALTFLNSGIAMATLMYPFRNAKLLVVTFWLLAWIILSRPQRHFDRIPGRSLCLVWIAAFCAMITDETAYFLIPGLWLYIGFAQRRQLLWSRRTILFISTLLTAFVGFAIFAYTISPVPDDPNAALSFRHPQILAKYVSYWGNPHTYSDMASAFGLFFMRRNFGYWSASPAGLLGTIGFLGILGMCMIRCRSKQFGIAGLLAGLFVVKTMVMPHDSGVHDTIMPQGTVFPSLLFFSYYYPYAEAVIVTLILGCLWPSMSFRSIQTAILAVAVSLISISHAIHLKCGPSDALKMFGWNSPEIQRQVRHIKQIGDVVSASDNTPTYLAFPTGHLPTLGYDRFASPSPFYGRIIPIKYLKAIESGQAIVSYDNLRHATAVEELHLAQAFYDTPSGQLYDLTQLKGVYPDHYFHARVFSKESQTSLKQQLPSLSREAQILFFVKGGSEFDITVAGQSYQLKQDYGYSYQMYAIDPRVAHDTPSEFLFNVQSADQGSSVYLVGPFVLQ